MTDTAHPAPARHRVSFVALLFGASAAPIFWLGQMMLGYSVSAFVCYPADQPVMLARGDMLREALIFFDAIAIIAALAGFLTALFCLRQTAHEKGGGHQALQIGEGRTRFMALWGIFSSLCFLLAILFNVIASATVPLCVP